MSEDQAAFGSGNQAVCSNTQNSSDDCETKIFPYKNIISFLQDQADNYLAIPYMKNILCK